MGKINNQTISVSLVDNSKIVENALEENILKALEEIGLQAVGYAALELENEPKRVDTGLLRNSLAYAVSGEKPSISSYRNDGKDKHGNPIPIVEGKYTGTMPKETSDSKKAVYVGTNVEYAPYVHEGAQKMKANRFLKNAIEKNLDTYKNMMKDGLKGK